MEKGRLYPATGKLKPIFEDPAFGGAVVFKIRNQDKQ